MTMKLTYNDSLEIRIDRDEKRRLAEAAARVGVTVSSFTRRAVTDAMQRAAQ